MVRLGSKKEKTGPSHKRFPSSYMATNQGLLESVEEMDDVYKDSFQ